MRQLVVHVGFAVLCGCSSPDGLRNEAPATTRELELSGDTPAAGGRALRSKEGARSAEAPAAQLFALAVDVEAAPEAEGSSGSASLDAGVPPASEPEATSDGGAAAPEPPPPPAPGPPAPPATLPRDIVAQSALPISALVDGVRLTEVELWDHLAGSPAVCFGELHDNPYHHYAETRALAELAQRAKQGGLPFGAGFEMFQRPFQAPLSAFVEGRIEEQQLLTDTEYVARWGHDFSLYRPLLESLRELQLPALALNMRTEITRKVGRGGLAALAPGELAEVPELDLQDPVHRAFIFGLFGVLPEHAAELGLDNVYTAQTIWDETMADTSARWLLDTGNGAHIISFAGVIHCHDSAIPARITRRTQLEATSVAVVFESELGGEVSQLGYDVLVVLDDQTIPP